MATDKGGQFAKTRAVIQKTLTCDAAGSDVPILAVVEVLKSMQGTPVDTRPAAVALLSSLKNGYKPIPVDHLQQGRGRAFSTVRALILDVLEGRVVMDHRVVLRVTQKFPLEDETLRHAARGYALQLLEKDAVTAAGIVMAFQLLRDAETEDDGSGKSDVHGAWGLNNAGLFLESLTNARQWAGAEALVNDAGGFLQPLLARQLVPQLIEGKQYKQAARCAHQWAVQNEFPEADRLYRQHSIQRYARKGQWRFAENIANSHSLHLELVQLLLQAGNWTLATELREKFALQDVIPEIDEELIQKEREARAEKYLRLPFEDHQIMFADSPTTLREQQGPAFLEAVYKGRPLVVGVDAEWRPFRGKRHSQDEDPVEDSEDSPGSPELDAAYLGDCPAASGCAESTATRAKDKRSGQGGQRAALLQVAARDAVLLLDLPALCSTPEGAQAVDDVVGKVFTDSRVLKLGLGIANDLKVLRTSWPNVKGFAQCLQVLEIAALGSIVRFNALGMSLSATAEQWLGKPLDKSQQISDWELRPLTPDQVTYAALDAWCSCAIFDEIIAAKAQAAGTASPPKAAAPGESPPSGAEWWRAHCFDVVRDRAPDGSTGDLAGSPVDPLGPADVQCRVAAVLDGDPDQYHTAVIPEESVQAKSIALLVDDIRVVVVLPAAARVNLTAVAGAVRKTRRQIRFATADECVTIFGYPPGSVPPVAHRSRAIILLDSSLQEAGPEEPRPPNATAPSETALGPLICVGGGAPDAYLCLTFAQLQRLTEGVVVAVTRPSGSPLSPLRAPEARAQHWDGDGERGDAAGPAPQANAVSNRDLALCVDSMLGKVGRWLRAVGCDVEMVDARETQDQISLLHRAASSGRIVITADRKLASRRTNGTVYHVGANNPMVQFANICERFQIRFRERDFLSRCAACNGVGYHTITVEEARKRNVVCEKTLQKVSEFYACKTCDKLYWEGPHSTSVNDKFAALFDEAGQIRQRNIRD